MRFAPSGSNCGAATAARFLHLFKFGLVVFRRETFGDGRQSRRLPAAFLYRPGRTQRPMPEGKPCADRTQRLTPEDKPCSNQTQRPTPEGKPHAERSPRSAPSPSGTRRSCPRSVRSRPAPDVDAQGSPAPHSPVLRHTGANIGTAGASAPPALPAREKSGARRGFCTRFAPLHHDCGLSNRREVSSFIKFGLVVFRRETFGDGRQSRRLPAAFFCVDWCRRPWRRLAGRNGKTAPENLLFH